MMNKLEIYIHIPFCAKKCDYCDFLSAPSDKNTMEEYVDGLINEIKINRDKMKEYLIDTVFIGGGTPSILEAGLIQKILNMLRENANLSEDAEITIECNPGTVTEEKLLLYKDSGINRISFGLQSTDNEELRSIGRIHTYEEFAASYHMARRCGFDNINIDIMSALPGQTLASYKKTLEKVISLNPEHISAYSLIVEEDTKMYERVEKAKARGIDILPEEEKERQMYYLTKELLERAGYQRYEISNYAKRGMECRHNIGYWQRVEYLGFGVGAASLYKETRYKNISNIGDYLKILNSRKLYEDFSGLAEEVTPLSHHDKMEEFMFLGLRMTDGVDAGKFEELFHVPYDALYGAVTNRLIERKLIKKAGNKIALTEKGGDVSNYVMSEFLLS